MVLGHRDLIGHRRGLILFFVKTQFFADALDQGAGIGLVVDGEVGRKTYLLGLGSQYAGKDGMEGAHLQVAGRLLTDKLADAFLHLAGCLVGEGQGEDVPGLQTFLL